MKKGLLLSVVASTVLFAGGDIAPVQPVAEAPAAACDDFYGAAGVGAIASDTNVSSPTVQYGAAAVLGVNKEILSGLVLNAEVQGATLETATKTADGNFTRSGFAEQGGLTQFNLGYSFGNTAIKVGRFAVPKTLSPLVYTGTTYFGLKTLTVEGAMIANTDLADTTLWAAYAHNSVAFGAGAAKRARYGVVAAGFQNTSIADTTVTVAGYFDVNSTGNQPWTYKAAASVDHNFGATTVSLGAAATKPDDANLTFIVGGYVKQDFGAFDATLAATFSTAGDVYAKYTDITNPAGGKNFAVGAKLHTTVAGFGFDAKGSFSKNTDTNTTKIVAGAGVSKTYSGINFAVDYQFTKTDVTAQRVRAKAVYAF